MKALFRNKQAVQKVSGDVAVAFDELVSAINVQPLEVGDSKIRSGKLSPDGRLKGNPGDLFLQTDGDPRAVLWVKQAGTNDVIGWVPNGWLAFPSTAVPSTNPNVLDDYEEGAWTPTDVSGAGLALTVPANGIGEFVKVGQLVYVSVGINYPVTANGAAAQIGGLPFTTTLASTASGSVGYNNSGLALAIITVNATTKLQVYAALTGVAITNAQLTGKTVYFTVVYRAAT